MKKTAKAAPQQQTANVVEVKQEGEFKIVLVSDIRPSPDNRKQFSELALTELAASIKAMGVAQPILIRPVTPTAEQPEAYEIVAGERRWRGSKLAGLLEIPAMVRVLSDLDAAKIRILENLQRENPHEMEEAEGYEQLMMRHGYTADQLAEEINKSRAYVYARLKLCSLTSLVREQFLLNKISASTALLIARIAVPNLQFQAYKEIVRDNSSYGPMSHREAAGHIQSRYMLDLTQAPFQMTDAKLLAAAGSCAKCPKRSGNQPEVFKDISADVCTDPDCFAEKKAALTTRTITEANKKGIPILEDDDQEEEFFKLGDFSDATDYVSEIGGAPYDQKNYYSFVGTVLEQKDLPEVKAYIKQLGKLIPVFETSALKVALQRAGICRSDDELAALNKVKDGKEADPQETDRHSARIAKQKSAAETAQNETAYRVALYKKLRGHGLAHGFSLQSLRELTKRVLNDNPLPDDVLTDTYAFDTDGDQAICAHIDQAELPEIQLILIDLLLGETLGVSHWAVGQNGHVDDGDFSCVLAMAKAEGIDAAVVREQMFPRQIDTSALQYDDLVRIIAATPERINELSKAVIADAQRFDLISLLERAAHANGFAYAAGGWIPVAQGAIEEVEEIRVDGEVQVNLAPEQAEDNINDAGLTMDEIPAVAAPAKKATTRKATKITAQAAWPWPTTAGDIEQQQASDAAPADESTANA